MDVPESVGAMYGPDFVRLWTAGTRRWLGSPLTKHLVGRRAFLRDVFLLPASIAPASLQAAATPMYGMRQAPATRQTALLLGPTTLLNSVNMVVSRSTAAMLLLHDRFDCNLGCSQSEDSSLKTAAATEKLQELAGPDSTLAHATLNIPREQHAWFLSIDRAFAAARPTMVDVALNKSYRQAYRHKFEVPCLI